VRNKLEKLIQDSLKSLDIKDADFVVEHPADFKMGDYSTNVAIKHQDKKDEIFQYIEKNKPEGVEKVELSGPGFINLYLSKEFFAKSLGEILKEKEKFGKSKNLKGEKIMVEHTDPNPFKDFHIGHLMPNVIGSTLARTFERNGAEVKQANYQGDVGMHVAKALWADGDYAKGAKAFEEDEQAKKEIGEINKKIYDKSDKELNKRYEDGKKKSLEQFEKNYKRLGTKFDYYFFESEAGQLGQKIVEDNIGGVFEKSEGAVVFKGSHTRVFINSQGLPTYEAKDLGNAKLKFEKYPYTQSVIVTGNEIKSYFKVVLEAMKQVLPKLAEKTKHISHGMLRLPTGKMSSRTGDVITAEELIEDVKKRTKGNEEAAIGAIKYMILRQSIGSDIIFDIEKSVSTEGDSGVYLQYAYARANSILEKAPEELMLSAHGQGGKFATNTSSSGARSIERLLYRFPEIVERAGKEYAPHYITTYLTELAGGFNNFYAHEQVISEDKESPYRLAIVEAFSTVMKNGLNILGIPAPESL